MSGRRTALLLAILIALALLGVTWAMAQEGRPSYAGLAVVHGDGRIVTRCVSFAEAEISGLDLLQRTDVPSEISSGEGGTTLCSLDGEGCPASDCFCRCEDDLCRYWNYFVLLDNTTWAYADAGAGERTLTDGDADMWVWGPGEEPPPALSFEEICPQVLIASETPQAIFLPSIGGGTQEGAAPTGDLLTPSLRRVWRRYGSLLLLVLALAVYLWIRRSRSAEREL